MSALARSLPPPRILLMVLVLGGFSLWTAIYVRDHLDEFRVVGEVAWTQMLPLYGAFALILGCNGAFFLLSVKPFDVKLRRSEAFALSVAGSFTNLLLPLRAGAGLRALYLSRQHRLALGDFVCSLGLLYLMHAVTSSIAGLAGLALLLAGGAPLHLPVTLFFAGAMTAGIVAMRLDYAPQTPPTRFPLAPLHSILAGWARVRRQPALLRRLWLTAAAFTLASCWQVAAAFATISLDLSWAGVLVYTGSKNLTALASVTPGALGVVEAASIYLGRVLDYTPAQALLVQGMIRAVSISSLLVLGPLSLFTLRRRMEASGDPHAGSAPSEPAP